MEIFKEGLLEKRQRGLNHRNATHLKFQKRYFKLTTDGMAYYDEKKRERKKTVQLEKIKIIEPLDQSAFEKDFCFQVGDNEEVLYLTCSSLDERSDWMQAFQEAAAFVGNEMLLCYHPGVFSVKSKTWLCCGNVKAASGCAKTHQLERTVVRRTKIKDEKPSPAVVNPQHPYLCKVKLSSKASQDSGIYSERASRASENLENVLQEPSKNALLNPSMTCLRSYMLTDDHQISFVKFIAEDVLALMTNNCSVHIYDIPSNAIVHNIQLTEPIWSIDVWKEYLLIGSTLVHVVDTTEDHWRRIVVIDIEEKGTMIETPQHLAKFNSTGEFVTASMMGNKLTLWPQPSKSNELMTKPNMTIECGGNIVSLDSVKNTLFVAQKSAVDVFNWSSTRNEIKHILTISVPDTKVIAVSEDAQYVYMIEVEKGVMEFSVTTRHKISIYKSNEEDILCLAASYHPTDDHYYIITGCRSGKVQIKGTHESQKEVSCLPLPKDGELSAVTAVAYRNNMIAVGHQNGTLNIWGGSETVLVSKKTPLELLEISKFSVYLPGSFSRHAIIADTFSFEVDSHGGLFANRPSYSLEIPKGAIMEGESVNIQTGYITCLGNDLFQFPTGYTVVSSVVWFCAEHDIEFQKSLIIELQHCAQGASNLTVLKAKCSSSSAVFMFEPVGEDIPQHSEYATFETNHFCLFCFAMLNVANIQRRVCVIPIEKPYIEEKKEVIFCVCYRLYTCIREVNRQYKNKAVNHVNPPIPVSLEADRISFECSSGNAALKSGTNEVLRGELDFTHMDRTELAVAQICETYPPRIRYAVSNESDEKVKFIFSGMSYEVFPKCIACASSDEPPLDKKTFHGTPKMEDCPFDEPVFKSFH